MAEYWDLYDTNRQPLGRTHLRGLPLDKDTYHVVVSVWTVSRITRNSSKTPRQWLPQRKKDFS